MEQKETGLAKYLSRLDVLALSLSCIIGWGAFIMPGRTFLPIAGPAGTTIAFIISALIMGVIGVNYSYLMTLHPGIGGVYTYTKSEFGRGHAFLSAWFFCLSYIVLIPLNATAFAVMLRALFSEVVERGIHYQIAGYDMYLREAAIAVTVLVVIGVLAIYCKPFLQYLLTGLAGILLVGVISLSCFVFIKVPFSEIVSAPGFGVANPMAAILSIVVLAPWAFVGFEVISLETAHFRFPVKNSCGLIGLAMALGGLIYIAMTVVAVSVVPDGYPTWLEYMQDLDQLNGVNAMPTFYAAKELLDKPGLLLIGVTATAAVISSVIGFYRATSRILANMSDDDILNKFFSNPGYCYIFIIIISIVLALIGRNALAWFVDLSSLGAIIGFGYVSAAVYRTARRNNDRHYVWLGVTGLVISAVFAFAQLMPNISTIEPMETEALFLLGLWCLLGFAFYYRTMKISNLSDQESETTTISALFVLMFYSLLVWFIRELVMGVGSSLTASLIIRYGVVFAIVIMLGLLVMLRIAAQLKKRQMMLENEQNRVLAESKAKSQFLFNMSHDIRTPMNAIIGYTNLAKKEEVSPTARDYIEKIETSSKHLLALINDILEMSRIESGKIQLNNEASDLFVIFEEMHYLFIQQMDDKRIAFSIQTSQVTHRYVWCDRKNLNRVLLNLLSNAYKFTPEGGTITASVREIGHTEQGSGAYEFRVKDSGIGMSNEFTEKMFTAFERERTSTTSQIEGTGLGLAITKNIIDLMGGEIEVNTSPGNGTEIIIHVSFLLAKREDLPVEENEAVSGARDDSIDFSGKRLLLVDDNEMNREIAAMVLTQMGFVVEDAENGRNAVEKVASSEPGYYDLILMDIQMPVMNGYDAARAIRALENKTLAEIPIVAMTANAFKEDEEAAEEAGMQSHIAKPLDVVQIPKTLSKVLIKRPD